MSLTKPEPADEARCQRSQLETVLVVEDEAGVRDLATCVLRAAGYRVLAAARGADALTLLDYHRGRLDLLFTDVELPDMSGQELARRVTVDRPGLQRLYTSGHDARCLNESDRSAAFIGKPYMPSELLRTVREMLDVRHEQVA